MIDLDQKDAIALLADERKPSFSFEREIRLFQFQTWIYFPESEAMHRAAGLLAAAKLLEHIQEKTFSTPSLPAKLLKRLLENVDYISLYDAIFAPEGGLTQ